MSVIITTTWAATVPAIPSGFNVTSASPTIVTTATGETPVSGTNMLFLGASANRCTITYATLDGNSGNVQVQGTGLFPGGVNSEDFGVFARASSSTFSEIASTGYVFNFSGNDGAFEINRFNSGTSTNLLSVSISSPTAGDWYQITGGIFGATPTILVASVQRLVDGYWLNMSTGSFQSAATSIQISDSSPITGQGYSGWVASPSGGFGVYGSVWTLSTFALTELNAAPAGDVLAASATALPPTTLAHTTAGDTLAASAGFKDPATLSHTTASDAFAASAGFKSPATLAHTTAGDTAAATAGFKDAAALSHVTAGDTLAASAKFTDLFTIAGISSGDALTSSAHFAAPATIAHTTTGDAFAGISKSTFAVLTAAPPGDTAALSGHLSGVTTLTGAPRGDALAAWALVSPRMLATEHHDTLAGTASAGAAPGASLSHTTAGDLFTGGGSFTFSTTINFGGLEREDVFSAAGTESSSGALAAVDSGDVFAATGHPTAHGALGVVTAGDVLAAGNQSVIYHVYSNAGSGPINYGTIIATTAALTWTSGPLAFPDAWQFAVRAAWEIGGLTETNLDCALTLVLSATGTDITNVPAAPLALRAFPTIGGGIRVEWFSPPAYGAKAPVGFNVFLGTGSAPNYGVIAATALASSMIGSNGVANIAGLTGGVLYQVGVRAYNATGVEQNTNTVTVTPISTGPLPVQSLTGIATAQG